MSRPGDMVPIEDQAAVVRAHADQLNAEWFARIAEGGATVEEGHMATRAWSAAAATLALICRHQQEVREALREARRREHAQAARTAALRATPEVRAVEDAFPGAEVVPADDRTEGVTP